MILRFAALAVRFEPKQCISSGRYHKSCSINVFHYTTPILRRWQRRWFNSVWQCVCANKSTSTDLDCIFIFPLRFRLMQIAYQINRLKLLRFNWTTQSSSLRSVSWNFKNIHMKQRERIELLIPNAKTVHNSCDSISFASNLIEYSMAKDQKFISSTWSVKIWREKKFPFCSLGNCHRNSRLI